MSLGRIPQSIQEAIPGLFKSKQKSIERYKQVIAPEFNREFYSATYPDVVTSGIDPLIHFISQGWKEERDPNPWFSTSYYLAANPDVSSSGINPFFHYLVHGRLEGRAIMPSDQANRRDPALVLDQRVQAGPRVRTDGTERFGVIALVKNEADIIETFAAHVVELFDVIVFVDHGSSDGTYEFLKRLKAARREIFVYQLAEPGYIQAQLMNHVIRTSKELKGLDWIFMLDADEFLPFASREEFAEALAKYNDAPLITMRWKNLIPAEYWDYRVTFDRQFLVPSTGSPYVKVAFQPNMIRNSEFWVEQGNHSISNFEGGQPILGKPAFDLFHLPVRSKNQLSLKLSQGIASYLQLGSSKKKLEGAHWYKIIESLKQGEITQGHLDRIVASYGISDADLSPCTRASLIKEGYHASDITLAMAELNEKIEVPGNIAELVFRVNGDLAAKPPSEIQGRPVRRLETTAGQTIRRAADDAGFLFQTLPPTANDDPILDKAPVADLAFMRDFLRPSYWAIDDLTPSAWTGHIPFMFAFVSSFRPRRYAELGTHWGASFFAYCQAAARGEIATEAIAIDSWQGDEHAGRYDEKVFSNFTWILRKYARHGRYLREYFDDAAKKFENGSVDLLHIDGLHTYEAVRHDFETWLPKMSDRGVIFFHDTTVHERDFGVWLFWDEIRSRYLR